jgi:hydrogenase expression/formation protein HypD
MKYVTEYRNADLVAEYIEKLHQITTRTWTIMEVCGGQTHSLVKNGLLDRLPEKIEIVHGPGCPVCVTPIHLIDAAIMLAEKEKVILCTFGDMMRVPGSKQSLLGAKADGADIRMVYSPLDAVGIAQKTPDRDVVFFGVGFETTAPANALSVVQAEKLALTNYSVLSAQVLVPPAMEAILSDEDQRIQAFLAAGHVCTVMGTWEYPPISEKYNVPIIVTGFEPVDLIQGIYKAVQQLEAGESFVENQYARVVTEKGNMAAQDVIFTVYEKGIREWRGIGPIPDSGYRMKPEFSAFDAVIKYNLSKGEVDVETGCISGEIMKGKKKPVDCPAFGTLCTPENPLGAPMVSSEGACAAYFHYK